MYIEKKKQHRFTKILAEVLAKHRIQEKTMIPVPTMEEIVLDINNKGAHPFEYIIGKLFVIDDERYPLLFEAVKNMIMRYRCSIDTCSRKLGYNLSLHGDDLIIDLVYAINEEKGYAYDYIMGILGLAYLTNRFC
ncbi:MAG: hypothetical protein LBE09_05415 [Christensenellaceae bacterium]|jgi:hypothetical protein|nr:hypothetical protein [Christensenellaceae bacterium]